MGLISRVSSRTYREKMRFAKREAGKWATYNVKEASTWSEQQKETKKLIKLTEKTSSKTTNIPESLPKQKKKKIRMKNHFENVLNEKIKMDKKLKKSGKHLQTETVEEKPESEKLISSNDERIKKNLGGSSIYKVGGACHECGSQFHLVRDCPEVEARRQEKKLKKKKNKNKDAQFEEEDGWNESIPIAHGFVMDESRGIEDEYYIK